MMRRLLIATALAAVAAAAPAAASTTSNIDSANRFAWGENIGWINFDGSSTGGPTARVSVNAAGQFSGFAWGENVGWINFDGSSTGGPTARVTAVAPTASQIASGLVGTTPIPLLSDRQPDNVVDAADVVSRVQAGAP